MCLPAANAHTEEREALMSELKILSHLEYCSHGDLLNFLRAHAQDFMASVITVDEVGDEVFYKNVTQQEKLRSDSGISCWSEYQEMQPALFPGQNDQGKSPYPNVVVDTNFYKMIKDGHHMEQPEFAPNEM
ncbi:hypothetical protein XENOCAPTIV_007194 [Xenoophorus captivus]|uniref:Uncharacterized protein n=1 Tax=Xenoophorus captivus TaxID=1517983 RepID=A0ABV0SE56_9TELE